MFVFNRCLKQYNECGGKYGKELEKNENENENV